MRDVMTIATTESDCKYIFIGVVFDVNPRPVLVNSKYQENKYSDLYMLLLAGYFIKSARGNTRRSLIRKNHLPHPF